MDQEKHPSDLVAWQAVLAYQVGAFEKSINLWRKAAEGFLDSGVIWRSAECECNIAVLFTTLGQFDQAIEQYERAKNLYNRMEDSKRASECDKDIGNCLVRLGKSTLALGYFRQAKTAFQRLNLDEEILGCDIGMGAALHSMARFQDALVKYREAMALSIRLGEHETAAKCEDNIGIVLREFGQPEEALPHHQRAMQVFQKTDSHRDATLCAMNMGSTLDVLGRLPEAMRFFEQAITGFSLLGLKKETAECEVNLGAMLLNHKQPDRAIGPLERARSLLEDLGLRREIAGCDMNIGSALRDIGKIDAAMERYSSAKRINMNLGLEFETAMCDLAIGVCLAMEAERVADSQIPYVNALSNLEAGLDVLERFRADVSFIEHRISFFQQYTRFYEAAALCCIRLGRMAEALQYLERCRSRVLAEAVATNLLPDPEEIGEELYAKFISARGYIRELGLIPLYGGRDKTDIRTINLPAEASVFSQAQNEFHELVGRIVEEYPDSSFVRRLISTKVRYLKEAREYVDLLPDNCSCLLEFMTWGPDRRLRAFFVTRQRGIELLTFSEHSLTSLNAVLRRWLKLYDNNSNTEDKAHVVWRTCRELHDLIFGAAIEISGDAARDEEASSGCKTLLDYIDEVLERSAQEQLRRIYIVPDSFLALLPLHAACRDQENQAKSGRESNPWLQNRQPHYLLEDHIVSYAPSAYLLHVSQNRQYPIPEKCRAMSVGNPQPLPDAVPLPGASEEARAVAQCLTRHDWIVDLLVEKDATKQAFLDGDRNRKVLGINSGMYDHLHLAQHAGIFDHGHQAHLYFARSSRTMAPNDYICFDSDIAAAPLQRARSVVAAACLTAATDPNLSEYLAMGAAFLQAGVGTFIGTLYPLSDKGSSVLVPELYRLHLESGLSWGEALRQAQLQMVGRINTGSPKSLIEPPKYNESKGILSRIFSRPKTPAFSLSHPYHWAAFTVNGKE